MPADPRRAKRLFDDALERPPADRAAFLDGACGGDVELRRQVDALLSALERADEFLVEPAAEAVEQPGTVIDRYKLLQEIGEGGMGTVWMAEQQQPVRRRVALKVIKLGMDTRQVVARFEAERQALAMMDHPSIAKVLDGGATQQGRPYFVMELVKGVPITEYCDQASLGASERLELFQQVCHAVQHAHQKGVIHRDLKPGNILVTNTDDGSPLPKVIDFGIAKATSAELTQKTLFTEFRQMVGTPEYMAPEQAELTALDVDTRADVYSLGVLLYELLTGTKPFELSRILQQGYAEMMRVIREDDPPKPSTRVSTLGENLTAVAKRRHMSPAMLSRLMRGDLDWIVMRALEKDRNRRYATANDLAADIGRHLSHEPVHASPPSASYRLRKYVRRHRVGVTAAALVFVALIGGLALATWGFLEAEDQRIIAEKAGDDAIEERNAATAAKNDALAQKQRADEERDRAQTEEQKAKTEAARASTVISLVEEMLGSADPSQQKGPDYTVRELLDDFDRGLGDRLKDQPEVEITIRELMVRAYKGLTLNPQVLRHRRALVRLTAAAYGDDSPRHIAALHGLGKALIASYQWPESAEVLERALELAIQRDAPRLSLAHIRLDLGSIVGALGDTERAVPMVRGALQDLRELLGEDDPELADAWSTLSGALLYRSGPGDLDEAEAAARTAIRISEDAKQPWGGRGGELHLGKILVRRGDFRAAEELYRKALASGEKYLGGTYQYGVRNRGELADVLARQGRYEEAEKQFRQALAVARDILPADHPEITGLETHLAPVLSSLGKHEEAISIMRAAVSYYEQHGYSQALPSAVFQLANALRDTAPAEALEEYQRDIGLARETWGDGSESEGNYLSEMGSLLLERNDLAGAATRLEQALEIQRGRLGQDHYYTRRTQYYLADAWQRSGRASDALALLLSMAERQRDNADPFLEITLGKIATVDLQLGDNLAAEAAIRERRDVLLRAGQQAKPEKLFSNGINLAVVLTRRGAYTEAITELRGLIEKSEAWFGEDHESTVNAQQELVATLQSAAMWQEAEHECRRWIARYEGRSGPAPAHLPRFRFDLITSLQQQRKTSEATDLCRRQLRQLRESDSLGQAWLASGLAQLAELLLLDDQPSDAESPARECLEIREQLMPDSWLRYNAMSLLGGALADQGKYVEAEPLLLEGFEKMVVPPTVPLPRKRQALERIVKLYEAWGREGDAAKWRSKLEEGR